MSIIKIVDVESGLEFEREMTEDELAQLEADKTAAEEAAQTKASTAAEEAAAKAALLERLGITEEEAKLLLS